MKQHSPHQVSFNLALKEAFGPIELVSYRQIKNPSCESNGPSNENCSLGRTTSIRDTYDG